LTPSSGGKGRGGGEGRAASLVWTNDRRVGTGEVSSVCTSFERRWIGREIQSLGKERKIVKGESAVPGLRAVISRGRNFGYVSYVVAEAQEIFKRKKRKGCGLGGGVGARKLTAVSWNVEKVS